MKKISVFFGASLFVLAAFQAVPAMAAVTMTTGAGSAVSVVQGAADFDPANSLNVDPYLEGGMEFSRTGLSFNNNGCGYAGCAGHVGFTGFSGNYMYGVGNGYFDIKSAGSPFSGLEFLIGTGFGNPAVDVSWQAFLNNTLVGSGSVGALPVGTVVGFSGGSFNMLRYTDSGRFGLNAPAFDTVRAQFSGVGGVPEPATWAMMILGFGLVGAALRKRQMATVRFAF